MNNKSLLKKVSNLVIRLALSGTSLLALAIVTANVNSTCQFIIHQPKLPESAKKLRGF